MSIRHYTLPFSLMAALPLAAVAVEDKPEGFIEGSSVNVLARNFYFNRDDRKGQSSPTGNGYSEAWAQGLIGKFESGFTQGTVGFGLDAFAMYGLKLDSGTGRSGGKGSFGMLPVDSNNHPESGYSKFGGAAKVRVLDTVFNPFALPEGGFVGTAYDYVAQALRDAESFTPRLLAALRDV